MLARADLHMARLKMDSCKCLAFIVTHGNASLYDRVLYSTFEIRMCFIIAFFMRLIIALKHCYYNKIDSKCTCLFVTQGNSE